jgi:hypothetical protein
VERIEKGKEWRGLRSGIKKGCSRDEERKREEGSGK